MADKTVTLDKAQVEHFARSLLAEPDGIGLNSYTHLYEMLCAVGSDLHKDVDAIDDRYFIEEERG